ncbi:MAG: hypothetical protein AAGC74_07930 [Verrucomicrobiota bacterium]
MIPTDIIYTYALPLAYMVLSACGLIVAITFLKSLTGKSPLLFLFGAGLNFLSSITQLSASLYEEFVTEPNYTFLEYCWLIISLGFVAAYALEVLALLLISFQIRAIMNHLKFLKSSNLLPPSAELP